MCIKLHYFNSIVTFWLDPKSNTTEEQSDELTTEGSNNKTIDFLGIITASLIPRITTRPTTSSSDSNAYLNP